VWSSSTAAAAPGSRDRRATRGVPPIAHAGRSRFPPAAPGAGSPDRPGRPGVDRGGLRMPSPRNGSRIASTRATTGSSTEGVAAADMAAVIPSDAEPPYIGSAHDADVRSSRHDRRPHALLLAWGGRAGDRLGIRVPDWPRASGRWIPRRIPHQDRSTPTAARVPRGFGVVGLA
jgi:hypothetical protein